MPPEIASTEPTEIVKGQTVKWTKTYNDFPVSEGWALEFFLRGPTDLDVLATTSGDSYLFTITATNSDTLAAGNYWWQSKATLGAEVYPAEDGALTVNADLEDQAGTYDGRSDVKKTLDALNAMILGKASKDQKDVMVGDRRITRLTPKELTDWQQFYEARWAKEQAAADVAAGKASGNTIKVRFGRP